MTGEIVQVARDGRRLTLLCRWSLDRTADGTAASILTSTTDITNQKQITAVRRAHAEQQKMILEGVQDHAIFMMDLDRRIITWTPAAESILGFTAEEAIGQSADIIFTPEDRAAGAPEQEATTALTHQRALDERWHIRKGGVRFWGSGSMTALRDDNGKPYGLVKICRDATARKQAEQELRSSEERLRLAADAAQMGFWDWDLESDTVTWDPVHNRIFGLPLEQTAGTADQFMQHVHPDDRAGVEAAIRSAVKGQKDFKAEYRVKCQEGSERWVTGHGRVRVNEQGKAWRVIGGMLDITERKLAEQQRVHMLEAEQAARATAEAANNTKDQFLANASHELRTPLSAILLWSNLLQGGSKNETLLKEGLAAIDHSAKSQQRLIEDLLDTARISAGKIRLDVKPIELATHVAVAVDTVRPTAESKDVTLHADFADDVGHVLADADRVEQIVWNLLSNAVKFTPAGGRVDLSMRRRGRQVEIRVSDTGAGIPPDLLPDVFTRFRQVDPTSTRRHGGLGLGLAISRQLVELHGGTIAVTSGGIGQGATFTVLLPLPRRAAGAKIAPGPRNTAGTLGGVRVLLVEDDPTTRQGLTRVLGNTGATIEAVGHVEEALTAIRRQRPDVIVSDIGLPDRDGLSFLRQLRADDTLNTPRLPALALSAFNRPQDRVRALESGFDDYLSKPVETPELVGTLRKVLGME